MSYSTFAAKYGDRLPNLTEAKYLAFLPDAQAEVSRYQWGTLEGRAIDMLVGHLLELSDSSSASNSSVKSIRIDGEITVTNADTSQLSGYGTTGFGKEYERLLGLIGGGGKIATAHYGGVRSNSIPMKWG